MENMPSCKEGNEFQCMKDNQTIYTFLRKLKNKNLLYNYITMATVSNYTCLYDLSRIGDDQCGISGRDQQNNEFGTYSTTNYFANWCGMKKPIAFATNQPNVYSIMEDMVIIVELVAVISVSDSQIKNWFYSNSSKMQN